MKAQDGRSSSLKHCSLMLGVSSKAQQRIKSRTQALLQRFECVGGWLLE